ncbi:MAG: hypothetical protein ACYDHW_02265 [Syntrophorhabdaceae bacterium]
MMPYITIFMLAILPFIVLSVFTGIHGLPSPDYDRAAYDRAKSEVFMGRTIPGNLTVYGRDISVDPNNIDNSASLHAAKDRRGWRKAMVEQALINTCIYLQARCHRNEISLLWAFLPQEKGEIYTDIWKENDASSLDCSTATDREYAEYGRYIFKNAIPRTALSDVATGTMGYSKPLNGDGCSFYDLVDLQ